MFNAILRFGGSPASRCKAAHPAMRLRFATDLDDPDAALPPPESERFQIEPDIALSSAQLTNQLHPRVIVRNVKIERDIGPLAVTVIFLSKTMA
jgi:hypothetical protein